MSVTQAEVAFYAYPGAGHALTGAEREQFLGRVLTFFAEHVAGG